MSYLENLQKENSRTRTMNGAAAYNGTGNACLDLFAVAGGMRYRSSNDLYDLFDRALIDEPDLAMKLLFYIRDIRGGMGERRVFRVLIRHTAFEWPDSVRKNVHLIAEYGRWDDLFCLMGTPVEDEVIRVIREQLNRDLESVRRRDEGEGDAPVSLLAKWMPSGNTSSPRTRRQAYKMMKALEMKPREYRKMLSKLRAGTCLTECYLSGKEPERIRYEAVPAGAMLKYRKALAEGTDRNRFAEYIRKVDAGKKKIHVDTLFPYEIMRPYFKKSKFNWMSPVRRAIRPDDVLETLWKKQNPDIEGENAICVVDTSGSMFCSFGDGPMPALISQSLGLYFAERCKGYFHDHLITFESNPHLVKVPHGTLRNKLRFLETVSWGFSTNLEGVFDLLLDTAVKNKVPQAQLPSVIYIISDMEFNCAIRDANKSIFENAQERFSAAGYELPTVVFHNVNSWHMQVPVRKDTTGSALVSGAGTAAFREKYGKNTTPLDHMLKVLGRERYAPICA